MPASDQGMDDKRYKVIPRTLIFVMKGEHILLIRGAPHKRLWANKYNGIGGHIEPGENALDSATRELLEETGQKNVSLHLAGTILVDVNPKNGIFISVFMGNYSDETLVTSKEGTLEWIHKDLISHYPVVEDLQVILPYVIVFRPGMPIFHGHSYYNNQDELVVEMSSEKGW